MLIGSFIVVQFPGREIEHFYFDEFLPGAIQIRGNLDRYSTEVVSIIDRLYPMTGKDTNRKLASPDPIKKPPIPGRPL